ncbi:MAG: hypothetical protein KatS3mg081_1161 [Gemmatimonadales bacterium]|nr:hypothetical protein HRbin33_00403 [bacterium HR33]GIW51806.1 MAG: hypothetical protein KatS3mg081_1161 [Gemmatimonadales bacterium]
MSEAAPSNPVSLVLGSAAAGASFGAAATTAGVTLFRTLQSETGPLSGDGGFLMLTAGLLAGIGCAFTTAWLLAKRVPDLWRRGAVGFIAVFGSLLLSGAAAPADALGGTGGLVGYLLALLAAGVWSLTRARRAAGEP